MSAALSADGETQFKYYCQVCDYGTCHKSHWGKHVATRKHLRKQEGNKGNALCAGPKVTQSTVTTYVCEGCKRSYSNRSSLWKHKKRCIVPLTTAENKEDKPLVEGAPDLLVRKLCEAMDVIRRQNDVITQMAPKVGNNNNNTYNFHLFLSEKCGSAMTIQNFMKHLEITMSDLMQSKTEAITNVIISNLEPLSLTDRPVHAIKEGAEWFVHDETVGWAEDDGDKIMQAAEDSVQKKWPSHFALENPDWMVDKGESEKYVQIAKNISTELTKEERAEALKSVAKHAQLTEGDAETKEIAGGET